ncbi:MAG: hypothetical protein C5S44_02785 [Candidatus Methanocomedens sp.]|nr:MAG: hypothetical protein C5S44_02785 [ANME-2 cluster archaeon]
MLKKKSVLFISAFVILALLFSLSTASAYPDMADNGSNNTPTPKVTTSSYGANVVIIQHLIEVDQVTYPGYLGVVETIIYKNLGTENYSGPVYTYVQDGAFNIAVTKTEMAADGGRNTIEAFQVSENVVGWNDIILSGPGMAPMYQIEYMVPAEPTGKTTESVTFTKKLKYPTDVNYIYMPITGMRSLVVKLVKSDGMKTTVLDNEGSIINADFFEEIGNLETYYWDQPLFVEISFELSKSNEGGSDITLYLIILLVIIAVISYVVLRGRSPAIKGLEGKLGSVLPKKQDEEIYLEEEEFEDDEDIEDVLESDEAEDEGDEGIEEDLEAEEDEVEEETSRQPSLEMNDIDNLSLDELQTTKQAIINVLLQLDEDHVSGIISEDEYNDIRDNYKEKAKSIMVRIEMLENED